MRIIAASITTVAVLLAGPAFADNEIVNPQITDAAAPAGAEDAFPTSMNDEAVATSYRNRRTPGVYFAQDLSASLTGSQPTDDLTAPTEVNGAIVDSTTMKTPGVYIDEENAFPNEAEEHH